MEITIKIDRRGTLTGSAKYVSDMLATAKVYQNGRNIFVEYVKGKDKEGKDLTKKEAVCGIINTEEVLMHAKEYSKSIWKAYAYDDDLGMCYEKYALFDCVLTEKGKEIAEEFIDKCAAQLQSWFEEE